ncbi:unnamed protein product [Brachionus calyciflorus]|uniref:ATP-dependent RNA helicase n=1 Tax=Brachionus calyciflorus TaxID=104777 RepID=A0A813V0B6_9BILA|nr:unnamed protein product [Brachionus calyciflorus]
MNSKTKKPSDEWPDFLDQTIRDVLMEKLQFKRMTPVQSVVVPIFTQQHKDVVVEAVTGSGKTLSFVVPILEILLKRNKNDKLKKHDIGALIISPTRELAQQIFDVVNQFLTDLGLFSSILFVGGNSISDDLKNFESNGANIIVATVGRLEDLLTRQNSALLKKNLKSLEVLIMDEADRLLDMGFKESLESIFKYLPKQRKTGLFSATQTDEIDKLIRAGLRNPCNIQVKQKANTQKTPIGLKNYYTQVQPEHKFHLLIEFLKMKKNLKHIVFMNSCACVQYFTDLLKMFMKDCKILSLHRKIKDKRTKVFNEFKNLEKGILVCTDILSRGIDIEDVDWVVQFDPPNTTNSFVHRCGRTARSNREGNALVFLLPNEDTFVKFIHINQQVPLQEFSDFKSDNFKNYEETLNRIHLAASNERELYEKGKIAFVSFIRAYTKHECSHIFRVKELDMVQLGKGFGLLHMPKMPELNKEKFKDLPPFYQKEVSTISYKNKSKEKLRIENMQKPKVKRVVSERNKSWSNNTERKLKKDIKKKKKDLTEKKRKLNELTEDDYKELEEDFKMLKKLKKTKTENDILE